MELLHTIFLSYTSNKQIGHTLSNVCMHYKTLYQIELVKLLTALHCCYCYMCLHGGRRRGWIAGMQNFFSICRWLESLRYYLLKYSMPFVLFHSNLIARCMDEVLDGGLESIENSSIQHMQ